MPEIHFVTLNPGHFHAALVQKEMYEQASSQAHVYAPLGADLIAHLGRIAAFNGRQQNPTRWELEVHGSDDYLERMRRDKPGNVVVLAGRNARKIDALIASLEAGMHVLADKPLILVPEDLPRLQQALDLAGRDGLIAQDIMTERHEITSLLQRELIHDEETFGTMLPGSADEPGVSMESVHYLKKLVAGVPLRRPPWYFDIHQQGEALSDVGTHLVDLVMWMLFPEQAIAPADLTIASARRWPTVLTKSEFQQITGEMDFPEYLKEALQDGRLYYFCNTLVNYALRGAHVRLNVLWDLESTDGGGDTHFSVCRGSRSRVEIRQGREQKFQPELLVVPNKALDLPGVRRALVDKIQRMQPAYPGLGIADQDMELRVTIPREYRIGHEAHFAQVTKQFIRYVQGQDPVPAWQKPNLLAKYFVTTQGVALSRQSNG